ncbi:hypothetical protein TELCIR_20503, partial [Teladorsagia circumcincta]
SVVVACLDLLDILVRCANHPERNENINDMQTIFINMHHLINEYCPLRCQVGHEESGLVTVTALHQGVPAVVPTITFLSGGESEVDATI